MYMSGWEGMGTLVTKELRPAEMVETRDAAGNVVEVREGAPPIYITNARPGISLPLVLAGGAALFFILRASRGR